jgi:hypothetical protein
MRHGDIEVVWPRAVRLNLMGLRSEVVKSCEDPLGKAKDGQSDVRNGRLPIHQRENWTFLDKFGLGEVI